MKKSSVVMLVISGALLAGCDSSSNVSWGTGDSQTYTNNHYEAGRGYYHAPYRAWYPFPYNYHDPALGYYYGGGYSTAPHVSAITESAPAAGSASSRSSAFSGSSTRSSSPSSSSVTRGGFSSSHSSGGSSSSAS